MNAEAMVGTVLGTCTLQKLIGQGSMGAVFLAQQSRPNRQVAVKVLLPSLPLTPQQRTAFLERFRRETDAAASLEHPNIMPVHEYGELDGLAYLVMSYISGGTLRDELEREKALSFSKVVNYLDQLAAALDCAHERGVIHRDVKPANILMTPDGRLLLTDFGLVKIVTEGQVPQKRLTSDGVPMGTPDYMAPEQVTGGNVDARADIYSLGVILYQMVTGATPFEGETPMQIAMQHLHTPPDPPRLLRTDLPSAAEQVILRALAKRPLDRYVRASIFANAFRVALTAADIQLGDAQTRSLSPDITTSTRLFTPRGLFDPTWQKSGAPATSDDRAVIAPAKGDKIPLADIQGPEAGTPPSRPPVGGRGMGRRIGLLRSMDGDEAVSTGSTLTDADNSDTGQSDSGTTALSPKTDNPTTPPPAGSLPVSTDVQPAAKASGFNPLSPLPFSRITTSLKTPTSEQSAAGAMKLTGPARVVHVPIAGQPGRYVTGLLPALPQEPRMPPAWAKVGSKLQLWKIALIAVAVVIIFGSVAMLLFHSRPNQAAVTVTPIKATLNVTATAQANMTATAQANIILLDPLSQNIHSWPTGSQGPQVYAFKDNAYHITDNDDNQGAPALLPDMPNSIEGKPFAYSVTMEEVKGDDTSINNAFGMIIRFSAHMKSGKTVTTFYSFEVANTKDGQYQFWKYDDSYGSTVSPWTRLWYQDFGKEFHVGQGPGSKNTFKIFMNGSKFTLIVNGTQVGIVKDVSFASGQVGMLVNWKGTEVAFSNLELTYN